MDKQERLSLILSVFNTQDTLRVGDILSRVSVDRITVYRDLQTLVKEKKIIQEKKWVYKKYVSPREYLRIPFFNRPKKSYNFDFLRNYIPNQSSFLAEEHRELLEKSIEKLDLQTDFFLNNKRLLEISLIDLSFASSYLEGNTYDYVDTEILIKYNEVAKEKTIDDTQMILNHKKCIEYMVHYKRELPYTKKTFFEVHTLLGEKLLPKENLGIIRTRIVEIGASTYTPLDNTYQLEEEFGVFLTKLEEIQNPFEQSLFILIFIPYFQVFLDINKRTSRMSANLPLLKNNLPLISLLAVDKRRYIDSILAIYELCDVSLMTDLFVENYLLNMHRYI